MLGIYLCITGFKLIIDTLVHRYVLHTVYGWSLYLLGAIWNSITQLLLHLGKGRPKTENPYNTVEEGFGERQAYTKNNRAGTNLSRSPDKGNFRLYIRAQGLDSHITKIHIISEILLTHPFFYIFYHMLRHVDNPKMEIKYVNTRH